MYYRLRQCDIQFFKWGFRATKYTSCKDLVNRSGELSVHQLIALHTLLQVHKVVLKKKPEYIFDQFSLKLPENARIFPHRQEFTIPINTKLSISRSSFLTRGARLWNRLPLQLRKCNKTDSFKHQAKKWVKNHISIKP